MLLIGREITSVPLIASTDPLLLIAVLWVTAGAFIAIATWEIGRFFDRRRTDDQFDLLRANTSTLSETKKLAQQNATLEGNAIQVKKIKYEKHLANRLEVAKFTLVDLFSIVFGIATSYIALLSNPQIMELQIITEFDIYSLLGIGLGIGTIAGLINRP